RFAGTMLLLGVVLTACAPSPAANREIPAVAPSGGPARTGPKSVTIINSGTAPGLDNRFVVTSNNAAGIVLGLYAGKLIQSDSAGVERMPRLAEALPSFDNGLWKSNADGTMETRLTIKSGAKWHDGAALTTKDLLFNDEVYLDKSLPQLILTARNFVDHLEALDDRTLIVHWKSPYILADIFSP